MANVKLISWNMANKTANWLTVLKSGADAAMLQEAGKPPGALKNKILLDREGGWAEPGTTTWRAAVVGMASSKNIEFTSIKTQALGGSDPYALMVSRPGSLSAAVIKNKTKGEEVIIVSMYATWMNPILQTGSSWIYADASAHRLISDLCGLIGRQKEHKIIAAGDLNILKGYGEGGSRYWKTRYDTVFSRMSALGMRFLGPQAPEGGRQAVPWPRELPVDSMNVPTYFARRKKPETAERQLDYVFASESIADRVCVKALNSSEDWGPSDHCRIMIDLMD